MKINQKIKIKNFQNKEVIEGVISSITSIDYTKIIKIKTEKFTLSIEESILNNSYKIF